MAATTAVISAIGGYDAATIRPFVESVLRRSRADLHLIDLPRTPRPAWLQWLAGEPRVHLHTCSQPMPPRQLGVMRFPLILQLMPTLNAEHVLLCDSRDALLQADPFEFGDAALETSCLWLAMEERTLEECPTNLSWLRRDGNSEELAAIRQRPILCAGTILGSKSQLCQALIPLAERIKTRIHHQDEVPWALDQSTLNLLAWQDQLGVPFTARGNHDGFALTLHHGEHLCLDRAGRLLLGNGQVAPIVHQYDRIPWLADHLLRQLNGFSQHG